jgi:hypothetical protein
MSDRHAKSGEDMMEVLAHDSMRYELNTGFIGMTPSSENEIVLRFGC